MRLFVALAIPAEVREKLSLLIGGLRRADATPKWIPPEDLHVTLKFIGETQAEKLAAIGDALAGVRFAEQVKLVFRDVGFFPNERRPSVAWVGVQTTSNLAELAAAINAVLATVGIAREEKAFVPHLTIARFKEPRLAPALVAEIAKWKNQTFGEFCAKEFHLVESKLRNTGAEYTTLRSFSFVKESPEGKRP